MWHQPRAVWAVGFACVIAFMGIGLVDPILKPIWTPTTRPRPARPSSSRSPTPDGRLHQVQGAFDADPSFNATEGRHADEREYDREPEQRQQVVDHVAQ